MNQFAIAITEMANVVGLQSECYRMLVMSPFV